MLALAYDSALRREELCSLRTDDLDPAHRMLRVRAETTKTRRGRVVPYSAVTGVLLSGYLAHRAGISRARWPLFLSESRRNYGEPLSLWSWSKVVRRVALAADVPQFSTHTTRHLCLTDLARMGWELHAIATFAGHRSTESTLTYIHLSGGQWTRQTNAAWVAAVDRMTVCDYVQRRDHLHARTGDPISPRTKVHILMATRTFIRDCQEWEWIGRRFEPARALALPRSVSALIGTNPRLSAPAVLVPAAAFTRERRRRLRWVPQG